MEITQLHAMLIQYADDQTPLTKPEYMPLSIQTFVFVRVGLVEVRKRCSQPLF
jgi:hypothetical protein